MLQLGTEAIAGNVVQWRSETSPMNLSPEQVGDPAEHVTPTLGNMRVSHAGAGSLVSDSIQ